MTPQQAQAQALIHEIDSVLNKASPRLPWVMTNEDAQQRQLLHQLRTYLANSVQTQAAVATTRQAGSAGETGSMPLTAVQSGQLDAMQQTLHAMMQEMNHLRSTVIQPLQADIVGLQQQRALLQQEVAQLESQRQAAIAATTPPPAAINQQVLHEMLQLLMQRLQESLSQQITQQIHQSVQYLKATLQSAQELSPAPESVGMLTGVAASQVQNLEALQARSDQILSTIDTTLRVVFESMQRNLESYQESLSRGLERMHGLGQQSEAQFAALLNHLAQRLGQEASAYLQTSLQSARLSMHPESQGLLGPEGLAGEDLAAGTARPVSPADQPGSAQAAYPPTTASYPSEPEPLPFAGTELGAPAGTGGPVSRRLSPSVTPSAQRAETLQLEDLDLSDFNLDALDTSLIDAEGLETEDADLGTALAADELSEGEGTVNRVMPPSQPATPAEAPDETLDFLSQLAETFDAPPLSRDGSLPAAATPLSGSEESPAAELRELYQSLFGSDEFAGTAPAATADVPPKADTSPLLETLREGEATGIEADLATLGNLFGEIDATIHPDSFESAAEPALAESWLSEGEAAEADVDLADSLDAIADIGTDLADLPSSLEDFFFPDDTAARPSVTQPNQPAVSPSEDEALTLDDLALEDLALGEPSADPAPIPAGSASQIAAPVSPTPSVSAGGAIGPDTSPSDLPDLDTDPFNLGALAAELGEPTVPTADLTDLLTALGDADAPSSGLAANTAAAIGPSVEDSFDAAAPEEDLLADVALQPTGSLEALQLDDNTLQQLSEDLFSLESGEFATAVPSPSRFPPGSVRESLVSAMPPPAPSDASADWASGSLGLPEVAAASDAAEFLGGASEAVPPPPPAADLSVEAFAADLFGDLEDMPAATPDQEGEADPSLVALEDLFTDSRGDRFADRGNPPSGDSPGETLRERVPAAPPPPLTDTIGLPGSRSRGCSDFRGSLRRLWGSRCGQQNGRE